MNARQLLEVETPKSVFRKALRYTFVLAYRSRAGRGFYYLRQGHVGRLPDWDEDAPGGVFSWVSDPKEATHFSYGAAKRYKRRCCLDAEGPAGHHIQIRRVTV